MLVPAHAPHADRPPTHMSQEDNTQQAPAAPNMRGRWRRPAARTTGQPAPQQAASFGAVEDIQNVKESLSGSHPHAKTETVAEKAPVEQTPAPAESSPVLVCCLEKETVNGETQAPAPAEAVEAKAEETCCCGCDKIESATAAAETPAAEVETPAPEAKEEVAASAETPAAAKEAAETTDEAELLKTDWRDERKRYVGLRPDPADAHPERVRSRPYEEREQRPDRGPRPERAERSERSDRFEPRPPRAERLNTEVANSPRVSEYAPSRDRNERNARRDQSGKPAPKPGLLAKILRFFGIGKTEEKPAQRPYQGQGERPAFRGPRQGGERYGNRNFRDGRDGRDGRSFRDNREGGEGRENREGNRNFQHGRRRRRSGGHGGQGGDYRRSSNPQGGSGQPNA